MRAEANRTAEMAVFIRVVEAGGFSAAARALGVSPSSVSKLVARLETRLGVRLFRRSTRRLALTPEGETFLARSHSILAELDAAEREVGQGRIAAGRIYVNSSASYVAHVLAGLLPDFLTRFPLIDLDIVQTDAVADLVVERTDVAIRAGVLADSGLVARPLGSTRLIAVATPEWIRRYGTPASPADLMSGDRLGFAYARAADSGSGGHKFGEERVRVSDGEGIRKLALAGVAPARLAAFTIRDDLAAGRLVRLFPGASDPVEPFHAVYVGRSHTLPQRVKAFLDYIGVHGMVS